MAELIFSLVVLCINLLIFACITYMTVQTSRRLKRIITEGASPSLVGRLGTVTEAFSPTTAGTVRVGDEEITARSVDTTSSFEVGDTVKVCEMANRGNTVLVCIAHGWI